MTVELSTCNATQRLVNWIQIDQYEWKCGNVRIIGCDVAGRDWTTWFVKLKINNRWQWAYCEQRPWGYGSAGQAKRGVSKWKNVFLYDIGPNRKRWNEARNVTFNF